MKQRRCLMLGMIISLTIFTSCIAVQTQYLEEFHDVPVFPKGTELNITNEKVVYELSTDDAAHHEVRDYYEQQMEEQGWRSLDGFNKAMQFEKGEVKLMIVISKPRDEKISVTITEIDES